MQDTVTSRELFERMPTRPALAEPEVAAHKVRSYEDDSTDWAPSGGRAAAPEQPAQPARRRPVRSTRNRDPVYTGQKTIGGTAPKRSAPLVRVGTELRFELIAKPALASHVHGERAVRVMGNIFAIAQLDMSQKKLRLPNGSVVVMTPCAVGASAVIGLFGLDVPTRAGRDSRRERRGQGPDAAGAGATRPHRHDPPVRQGTAPFYFTAA